MANRTILEAIARRCQLFYEDLRAASSAAPDGAQLLPEQLKPGEFQQENRTQRPSSRSHLNRNGQPAGS